MSKMGIFLFWSSNLCQTQINPDLIRNQANLNPKKNQKKANVNLRRIPGHFRELTAIKGTLQGLTLFKGKHFLRVFYI